MEEDGLLGEEVQVAHVAGVAVGDDNSRDLVESDLFLGQT